MTKKFLKVFSLLLVIAALVVPSVVSAATRPDITIAQQKVTLYDGQSAEVTLALKLPTCYGIEGWWSVNNTHSGDTNPLGEKPIVLKEVSSNNPSVTTHGKLLNTGFVAWTDVNGEDETQWLQNPISGEVLFATYTVPSGTPAGTYTVTFLCEVFAGEDKQPLEGKFIYSGTIVVEHHECSDAADDGDHLCDDPKCGKEYGACVDTGKDHICDTDTACTVYSTGSNAHADAADDKDHVCDYCGEAIENGETCSDVTTDEDHNCDVCGKEGITEHKHNTYGTDADNHWSICDCGQMVGETAAHTGGTATCMAQAVCETCEKAYGTLADHAWGEASYTDNGDGTHTASYTCGTNPEHIKSDDPTAHTYDETTNKCACGAEKPVTDVAVTAKGTINHTVEGQVVTVTHSVACKVGYWDETEGKYIAIAAVANADGSYSFTAPEGVTEVLLVVKGDANSDGIVNMADATRTRAHFNSKTTLTAEQQFAADANGDNSVNMADATRIRAAFNSKTVLTWG